MLKIATWNVNSLRVRLTQLLIWLEEMKPDIVALQEIKLLDEFFPSEAIKELGYFFAVSGQRAYNGVAVLSRIPPTNYVMNFPDWNDEQRRMQAVLIGDIRVINLYIPNGENVISEKYQYKMNWLKKLDVFLKQEMQQYQKVIVLGDFNIAPEEIDVHDPKAWDGQVLFSQPERNAFKEILGLGFVDCFRNKNPYEQSYSWWDYRMNAFKRDRGLRIDHILASHEIAVSCHQSYIDKRPRSQERPSDHAPVIAEFNTNR